MISNEDQMYDFFDISVDDQTKRCSSCYIMAPYEEEELQRIRTFAKRCEGAHKHTVQMYLDHVNVLINKLSLARQNETQLYPNNAPLEAQIASLVQIGRQLRHVIE